MEFDLAHTDRPPDDDAGGSQAARPHAAGASPSSSSTVFGSPLRVPAGGNHQKWRWVIVDDPDKKQVIADAYRRTYAPYIEQQQRAVERAGNQGEKNAIIDSSMHLADVLQDVPVLAIPCALGSPDDAGSIGGAAQGWWGSVIPSIWSYCLAARSRGLGTAWTTLHLGDEATVGRGARDSGNRHAARLHPHRVPHRRRLQARNSQTGRAGDVLEHLERHRHDELTLSPVSERSRWSSPPPRSRPTRSA